MLEQSQRSLHAVLESRSRMVENFIRVYQEQASYFAENDMIVQAMNAFTLGFGSREKDLDFYLGQKRVCQWTGGVLSGG